MKSLPIVGQAFAPHPPALLADTVTADGHRRYCTYPFRLFGIASDLVKPCTWLRQARGTSVLPVEEAGGDLMEVWRSEVFDNVRRSIADGEYHHCNLEFCPEYKGAQKYFFTAEELRDRFPAIHDFVIGKDANFRGGPEIVNLSHDTECNLSCPSCNRLELPKLNHTQLRGFAETLPQLGGELEYIFIAGMGDPFASQHYFQWLRTVDLARFPKLKEIILNTNGILWNAETWRAIPEATRQKIGTAVVSIDGASRRTYEENRYPAHWEALLANLPFIASLRERGEIKRLRAYFVYQWNNYHELPAMVALCRAHQFDAVFFARIAKWTGISQWMHDSQDVAHPQHSAHQDFLRVAAATAQLSDDQLEVVVMR